MGGATRAFHYPTNAMATNPALHDACDAHQAGSPRSTGEVPEGRPAGAPQQADVSVGRGRAAGMNA